MAKKARQYSAAEKPKVVLTAFQGDLTMAQISSQYGVVIGFKFLFEKNALRPAQR
jgi:transposase-like protein